MPQPLSPKLVWEKANPLWAQSINPIIQDPQNNSSMLQNIELIDGVTTFKHLLGRTPIAWEIVDRNASANIYRSQPFNAQTLTLTSSAAVTVSIKVY